MKLSLEQYKTNMANMWSNRTQINKLFDKSVEVLLRIHLAPKRERNYIEMLQRKKEELLQKKSNDSNKMAGYENLTRNQRRNLLRTDLYKRKKYQRKYENKSGNREQWMKKIGNFDKKIKAMSDTNKELVSLSLSLYEHISLILFSSENQTQSKLQTKRSRRDEKRWYLLLNANITTIHSYITILQMLSWTNLNHYHQQMNYYRMIWRLIKVLMLADVDWGS
jgi:hypothetical protein